MTRGKAFWALVAVLCMPLGILFGRYGRLTPSPIVLIILGLLAALCLVGIGFGIRDARRAASENRQLRN